MVRNAYVAAAGCEVATRVAALGIANPRLSWVVVRVLEATSVPSTIEYHGVECDDMFDAVIACWRAPESPTSLVTVAKAMFFADSVVVVWPVTNTSASFTCKHPHDLAAISACLPQRL
eukprot:m.7215 g.7215  ORF g.7215 m.7215 type:complete len:118 (-) comp3723_c0_seq1:271-624(-)